MGRHQAGAGGRRWRLTALLGVGAFLVALALTLITTLPGGAGAGPGEGPALGWGFTHTQYSADSGDAAAERRARKALKAAPLPQNQHVMGWGASNPEPSPGRYDFAELDRRVALMRASGSAPVLTLCCAPDWMKGGAEGRTDWSEESLETAPDPAHYQDFADLAAKIARRYPDVRHFVVWNEFKGFWNDEAARWDHEGYTALYNKVWTALKQVDEDLLVGGPYLVMDSVAPGAGGGSTAVTGAWGALDARVVAAFRYWNAHKKGADFVVVDGSSYTADDALVPGTFTAADKFTDVGRWVREETGGLPLWWNEYYVEPGDENDDRDGWSEDKRVAVQAAGMIALAKGGAATAFYWNPQTRAAGACAGCLWTSTERANGGAPLPMLRLVQDFQRAFGPGTRYRSVDVAPAARRAVRVLADADRVLVVNTRATPVRAEVDGRSLALGPYEVRWSERR
ncbi:GH39 family glycosyl hydrolase [Streptomyces sp. CA-253872]|uniref:GH39 family glycosyl hydrolase n=1 Tax=Streptomyces sp. CA-253872 TaxID=3240067 RepID=UPI003D8FCAA3